MKGSTDICNKALGSVITHVHNCKVRMMVEICDDDTSDNKQSFREKGLIGPDKQVFVWGEATVSDRSY